jgi:hypothetical protein
VKRIWMFRIGWVNIEFFPGWKKIKQRCVSFVLGYLRMILWKISTPIYLYGFLYQSLYILLGNIFFYQNNGMCAFNEVNHIFCNKNECFTKNLYFFLQKSMIVRKLAIIRILNQHLNVYFCHFIGNISTRQLVLLSYSYFTTRYWFLFMLFYKRELMKISKDL